MIRRAIINDLEQLADLFDQYRIFYNKSSDIEGAESFLKHRILNEESIIFVSEDSENKLKGFVQLYPIFSSTRMKRLWLLNDLFVEPASRGKGLSTSLMKAAQDYAQLTQSAGLILETAKDNTIGNNLYPKVGFTLDTEHNYYYWNSL